MAEELDQALLKPDESANAPPRIKLGEYGTTGLKAIDKMVTEEANTKLRMPQLVKEINEMKKDSSLSAGLNLYKMGIGRVDWFVKPPKNATPTQIERAKAIESMMHDMDHSWFSFIVSLLSCIEYGYSIHEKVFKVRTKRTSKFDDGIYGWKAFPPRAQQTVYEWKWGNKGRTLEGVFQDWTNYNRYNFETVPMTNEDRFIPRNKFMLFRTSPENDNPEGCSALKAAWVSWRYKKAIEEQEMIGIGRDLGGLLKMTTPAEIMSEDTTPANKTLYSEIKKAATSIAQGEQAVIILPSNVDSETKTALYDMELLTSQGSRGYDTNKIIQRYQQAMLVTLFADLLTLGSNGTGSFALSDSKQELIEIAFEYRLREIRDVLNHDLIPQTFAMNGWDDKELPTFEFGALSKTSLDELGKYIQRVSAVSAIEKDRELQNMTRVAVGLNPKPDDEEIMVDESKMTSNSGKGMESGMSNGTGDSTNSGGDRSVGNNENN